MTEHPESLTVEQKELVAIGASVGAGCHPCVRHHIKAAVKTGIDDQRVLAALATSDRIAADAVQRMGPYSRDVLAPIHRCGRPVLSGPQRRMTS